MQKIIAFSGAHGTGKSTLLEAIKSLKNKKIAVDDFKFSRSVLEELDQTLEEATSSIDSTKDFQSLVLLKKEKRLTELRMHGKELYPDAEFIFVDRSVADLYAYTALWSSKHPGLEDYLAEYRKACSYFIYLYDAVVFFPIDVIDFVDDGIRAKKEDQKRIHDEIDYFLTKFDKPKILELEENILERRVIEVFNFLIEEF